MKTENEIKTALLNEVIERIENKIEVLKHKGKDVVEWRFFKSELIQSMLPKEQEIVQEPEKEERTQEIKAGDCVNAIDYSECDSIIHEQLYYTGGKTHDGKFVCEDLCGNVWAFDEIRKVQPTKTQEQIDRERDNIIDCILMYDRTETHESKGRYFEIIQNDLEKLFGRSTKKD